MDDKKWQPKYISPGPCDEYIAEIARLGAENTNLRHALKEIVNFGDSDYKVRIAKRALEKQ